MEEAKAMGGRLKQARARAILTQAELAARSGVEAMTVSRIERGLIASPYPSTVRALADALGVDPAWLRFGDAERPARDRAGEEEGTADG